MKTKLLNVAVQKEILQVYRDIPGSCETDKERIITLCTLKNQKLIALSEMITKKVEEFEEPNGCREIASRNQEKARKLVKSLCIKKKDLTALSIKDVECSVDCQGANKNEFKLVDSLRLELPCGHPSLHLQCYLVLLLCHTEYALTCPFANSETCKWYKDIGEAGVYGPLYFPSKEVWANFFRALLRSELLSATFLKKELL